MNTDLAKIINVLRETGNKWKEVNENQILSSHSENSIDISYLDMKVNSKQTAQKKRLRLPLRLNMKRFCLWEMIYQGTAIFHNKPYRTIWFFKCSYILDKVSMVFYVICFLLQKLVKKISMVIVSICWTRKMTIKYIISSKSRGCGTVAMR